MWLKHLWLDVKIPITNAWSALIADFSSLKGAPREFWFVSVISYLEYFSLFAMQVGLHLYLTKEFGQTDQEASWVFGKVGMLLSVWGCIIGLLVDRLGVKKSLVTGAILLIVGRTILAFTHDLQLLKWTFYTIIPLGMALIIIALPVGIKRYTNKGNRSFGFTFLYIMFNVAAATAYPLIGWLSANFADGINLSLGALDVSISAYRLLILVSIVTTLVTLVLAKRFMREVELVDGELQDFQPKKIAPWKNLKVVLSTKVIWVFLLFMVFLLGVRMINEVYANDTFPTYFLGELGEKANYGMVLGINPIMVIFLTPFMTILVKRLSIIHAILLGMGISAIGIFWLTLGASYEIAIAFVVVFTLGECIWGPRLKEFMTTIAPIGQEGTYVALSAIPMAIGKFLASGFSGWLLMRYCQEGGTCNGQWIWLWIGCIAFLTPTLIFLFRRKFEKYL